MVDVAAISPPVFFVDDILAVGTLTASQVDWLVKSKDNLAPEKDNKGRGSARRYSTLGLAQFAATGAFYGAGMEVIPAGKIATALKVEFSLNLAWPPDNLEGLLRDICKAGFDAGCLPDDEREKFDRFAVYEAIRKHHPEFRPYERMQHDWIVEIIDRKYLFKGLLNSVSFSSPFSDRSFDVEASHRIVGGGRGEKLRIIGVGEELPALDDYSDETHEAWRAVGRTIEEEYFHAREHAVSALRVNLSLAIRNAFEAVIKHRNSDADGGDA